jgi:hypothetical protein
VARSAIPRACPGAAHRPCRESASPTDRQAIARESGRRSARRPAGPPPWTPAGHPGGARRLEPKPRRSHGICAHPPFSTPTGTCRKAQRLRLSSSSRTVRGLASGGSARLRSPGRRSRRIVTVAPGRSDLRGSLPSSSLRDSAWRTARSSGIKPATLRASVWSAEAAPAYRTEARLGYDSGRGRHPRPRAGSAQVRTFDTTERGRETMQDIRVVGSGLKKGPSLQGRSKADRRRWVDAMVVWMLKRRGRAARDVVMARRASRGGQSRC